MSAEGAPRVVVMVDRYPVLSETFVITEVEELRRAGARVSIEAHTPGDGPDATDIAPVRYMVEESHRSRLRDLAWLVRRHPLGCLRDLAGRRRWAGEETARPLRALAMRARRATRDRVEHIHVHFAADSALDALRIGRLIGVPFSVTAHAFDIFLTPTNLPAKLDAAAFVTTGCEYNAAHLRALARDPAKVHVIVMGVDTERFRRTSPPRGDGLVLAIGRLVEKKGFEVLVDAMADLGDDVPVHAMIVGDGPLRDSLEERASSKGLGNVVFAGPRDHDEVMSLLGNADVLAMPCIVTPSGDRDSMPVVCKEALAMEVPVVASDEVGLPELIRPAWGRLTPPGEPEPLARALAELLGFSPEKRQEMGRAGRRWVEEHCNARSETAKLLTLIEGVKTGVRPSASR